MESFELLARRRESCRAYDPDRRPTREQLTKCVAVAQNAPSACNSQPWSVVAVNSEVMTAAVAPCLQTAGLNRFASACPAFFIVTEEPARLMRRFEGSIDSQHYAQMDVGIAAAHLCLAAEDMGLSTCIIGSFDEEMLRGAVSALEGRGPVRLVIAVGYAASDARREKSRKPLETVLTYVE